MAPEASISQHAAAMRRRSQRGWSRLGSLLALEKTRLALLKWASRLRSRDPLKALAHPTNAMVPPERSLHLSEPLPVADLAARAGLSPSRFSRVFRDRFGSPPHRFLLHLRVQRAQDLLQHTGLTMRQISAQCGFSDVHHFARTFKKLSGQTPGSYRRYNWAG